jgi:hypothetical protein
MTSVDLAQDYARKLIGKEAGSGDVEEAMRRVEAKTGVGYWTLWGLWHRRRKSVDRDLFARLRGAYLTFCERQISALQHELAIEKARCGDDSFDDLVGEAEDLVAKLKAAQAKAHVRLGDGR